MRWVVLAMLLGACGEDGSAKDEEGCGAQDTAAWCQTCTPGEQRCGTRWNSNKLQTCGDDGYWRGGPFETFLCVSGECIETADGQFDCQ